MNNSLRIAFDGFCTLQISGKDRLVHGIAREIRNLCGSSI